MQVEKLYCRKSGTYKYKFITTRTNPKTGKRIKATVTMSNNDAETQQEAARILRERLEKRLNEREVPL